MIKSFCTAILLATSFLLSPVIAQEEAEGQVEQAQVKAQVKAEVKAKNKNENKDRIIAIDRPEAVYPKKAFNKCVEGHVLVRFIITTEGTTKDIQVISSRPERVFEKAAVEAVEKWLFEPRILNGVAVNREATQRLIFEPGCIR